MNFQVRFPHFLSSTVTTGTEKSKAVLDGGDVTVPNQWKLPPFTVALIGRPAVWTAVDLSTPAIPLGFATIPSFKHRFESDFGGHLFLAVTFADTTRVTIVEGGPLNPDGTGNLVPFDYPEDDFAERGINDFEPVMIAPPNGMTAEFFCKLVRDAHTSYDGDQRYLAIELPFLRVGRDSNSYAVGALLASGVDPRAIPKPRTSIRWEWTGYPGAEDPVHRANFGAYLGAPTKLATGGTIDVAYHADDGGVRYVVVGGEPNGTATLPDGTTATLDERGRIAFSPHDARAHGLPSRHTDPPAQIRTRRRFPKVPAPQGAEITLVVDGASTPFVPGSAFRGTIVERHDALGIATMRRADGTDVVLPLHELGVELRDPKRVDRLARVGNDITVGLRRDRHPKLVAHGGVGMRDRFRARRVHAPYPVEILGGTLAGLAVAGALVAGGLWLVRRATR